MRVIAPATPEDLPQVRQLLRRVHLTIEGIDDHLETMLVAKRDAHIIGTATVELYHDGALLRSLAVEPRYQGARLGRELTIAALGLAETRGAQTVFLLTTTAERFFPKFGFEQITRDDVPQSVRTSVQFRYACAPSSTVMRKRLG